MLPVKKLDKRAVDVTTEYVELSPLTSTISPSFNKIGTPLSEEVIETHDPLFFLYSTVLGAVLLSVFQYKVPADETSKVKYWFSYVSSLACVQTIVSVFALSSVCNSTVPVLSVVPVFSSATKCKVVKPQLIFVLSIVTQDGLLKTS